MKGFALLLPSPMPLPAASAAAADLPLPLAALSLPRCNLPDASWAHGLFAGTNPNHCWWHDGLQSCSATAQLSLRLLCSCSLCWQDPQSGFCRQHDGLQVCPCQDCHDLELRLLMNSVQLGCLLDLQASFPSCQEHCCPQTWRSMSIAWPLEEEMILKCSERTTPIGMSDMASLAELAHARGPFAPAPVAMPTDEFLAGPCMHHQPRNRCKRTAIQ